MSVEILKLILRLYHKEEEVNHQQFVLCVVLAVLVTLWLYDKEVVVEAQKKSVLEENLAHLSLQLALAAKNIY